LILPVGQKPLPKKGGGSGALVWGQAPDLFLTLKFNWIGITKKFNFTELQN
jgi:hypothetical protein